MAESAGPIIVTGGAGFVGANLVAEIYRRDPEAEVLVIDPLTSGSFANIVEACLRKGVGGFPGDFLAEPVFLEGADWAGLDSSSAPRAVFHLGANTDTTVDDEAKMMDDNTEGFDEMMLACASSETPLVYASSAATYGTPPHVADRQPFPEEAAGSPNNVYGFSKWIMENRHRRFAELWRDGNDEEPHIVGLRYFNVFGPGESRKGKMASMVFQLAQQVIAGKSPRLFADGSQARDQVYVDDVVSATLLAADSGAEPGIYNCGSGIATSFSDMAGAVREGVGVSATDRPTDYFDMPAEIRAFYQEYTCADLKRTKKALNWAPAHDPRDAMVQYAAMLAENARVRAM